MSNQSNSRILVLHTCPYDRQGTTESAIRLATRSKASQSALITREWVSDQSVTSASGNPLPSEPSLQPPERTLAPPASRGLLTMLFPQRQRPPINADEAAVNLGKAIRALRGNASVSARLTRYNRHMATARFLEARSASGKNLEWPDYRPHASNQDLGGPI
jgi:hypothetical protein